MSVRLFIQGRAAHAPIQYPPDRGRERLGEDQPAEHLDRVLFDLLIELEQKLGVHVPSFSATTCVYKVMGAPLALGKYFPDLLEAKVDQFVLEFGTREMAEIEHALHSKVIHLHTKIKYRWQGVDESGKPISRWYETTAGRAMLGAILGSTRAGEQTLLKRLARRRPDLFAGRVVCFDRNFPGHELITAILDAGGHVIARVKEGIALGLEDGPGRGWLPDGSRMTWLNAPSGKKQDRLPVRAAEPTTALGIQRWHFRGILESHPQLALALPEGRRVPSGPGSLFSRRPDCRLCSHVDVSGTSQVPRRSILCLCLGLGPRPNQRSLAYLSVSSMLPPLRGQRRLQRVSYFGAIARLQHLLLTLQE